jgi:hypothetical protein
MTTKQKTMELIDYLKTTEYSRGFDALIGKRGEVWNFYLVLSGYYKEKYFVIRINHYNLCEDKYKEIEIANVTEDKTEIELLLKKFELI